MNFKFLFLSLFAFSVCVVSCSKDNTQPAPAQVITHDTVIITHDTVIVATPTNPIVGLWVGTLTAVNEPQTGALYYSFDIRADSTILTYAEGADGNTYFSTGTWKLTGTSFSATITSTSAANKGTVQNLTATYNKPAGSLTSGVWENALHDASGTFSLNRIN
jgi:hypothetical protein